MDNQEVTFVKTKAMITQLALATKFPFWLISAMLDSIKSELLEGLYRNSVLIKEGDTDAASRPPEQHNGDVTPE